MSEDSRWFRVSDAKFNPTHAEFEVPADTSPENIEQAAHDAICVNMDWRLEEIDGPNGKVIGPVTVND